MRLSQYPGHPNPPIYEIIFPNGQKLLILGTTHTVPLGCMLPYRLAHELIEASDFTIDEINGELLPRKKNKTNFFSLLFLNFLFQKCWDWASNFVFSQPEDTPYMTLDRIQKVKNSCFNSYKHFMTPARIDEELSNIFDPQGHWYENAGIIADEDAEVDFSLSRHFNEMYPKNLKIKGKVITVPTENGKELHPAALQEIYNLCTHTSLYAKPPCGGMDDHLLKMAHIRQKKCFSLESRKGRSTTARNNISKKIDEQCSVWFGHVYFYKKEFVEKLEEGSARISRDFIEKIIGKNDEFFQSTHWLEYKKECDREVEKATSTQTIAVMLQDFYSKTLLIDNDPSVLARNTLWVERLVKLNEKSFNRAFAHVGNGHLHDLFKKLKQSDFNVSERVSLAKLDEILLEEDCVVAEHVARKTAMQAAFGI